MDITTVALLIIFAFTFIPLVLAEVARTKSRLTLEDFLLQGRNMPLLMVFCTVYATWVSLFAFLGSARGFYYNGPLFMTCFAWNALFALLFFAVGRRIWFYGKEKSYFTATDFFTDIYRSKALSVTITSISIIFTIPYLVIQLYGGAILIETVSGGLIPWRAAGLIFCLVIMIYLWAGGLRAVAMADVYYSALIFSSMIITGFVLLRQAGGMDEIFNADFAEGTDFFTLGDWDDYNSTITWLAMFVIIPLGALMGPPMWIRMFSAANERIFKVMPLLLTLSTIMYIGPLLGGLAAKHLYPGMDFSDNMLVVIIMQSTPLIFAVVLICGAAASSLSTANSQIHALAAVYTMDFHKKVFKKSASDRSLLKVGKWMVLVISTIVYLLTLCSAGDIINMGIIAFSGTAQIFVPALGALFWAKAHPTAACIGIWMGLAVEIALWTLGGFPVLYAALAGFIANALIFMGLSMSLPRNNEVKYRILRYKSRFAKREIT